MQGVVYLLGGCFALSEAHAIAAQASRGDVTVTIDQEVRKLDDNTLGWGNEKVVSISTQRVGSATRTFSINVGP